MGQAYGVNAIIVRDDGMSVEYRPRCPYCMYVDMMCKMSGHASTGGGSYSYTVCHKCGKSFEVILRREN